MSVYLVAVSTSVKMTTLVAPLAAQGIYLKGHLPDVRYFVWIKLALAENSIDIANFSLGNGKDLAI